VKTLYGVRVNRTLARGDRRHSDAHVQRLIRLAQPLSTLLRPSCATARAADVRATGCSGDSDRKSMQAMLARVTQPVTYQAFQHFITHAPRRGSDLATAARGAAPGAAAC